MELPSYIIELPPINTTPILFDSKFKAGIVGLDCRHMAHPL